MASTRLSDIILPNYWDLLEDGIGEQLEHSRKMFLRGGRFSGKSYFGAHHIILTLLALAAVHKEGDPWACCLALRKYSNTLKTSVYAELANAIINLGVESRFQMLVNPMEIRLKGTKSVIKFANLNTAEDYGKVKSIKWPGGYCRLIWFEEADQFMSKHDVDQVLLSLYRGGDIFETIFTYNTPFSPSHWLNVGWNNDKAMTTGDDGETKIKKEKVYFKHVNLYDIPRGIVPEQVYDMAEAMREENLQEWKHVIMGEVGDPATMVFPNIKSVRAKDLDWSDKGDWAICSPSNWRWLVGMDYGYRPDPTVCVVCGYNRIRKILWIVDETRGVGWSEEGIYNNVVEMLKRGGAGIKDKLGFGYITPSTLINSEIDNRIIDGLRLKGLNIYPVKKVSGSRDVSYQFLTGGYGDLKEIWIDSEQCPGCWAEFIGAEFLKRDIGGKEIIVQEWPTVNDHRDRCLSLCYNRPMVWKSYYWK